MLKWKGRHDEGRPGGAWSRGGHVKVGPGGHVHRDLPERNAEIMRPEGGRGGCLPFWFLAQLHVLPRVQTHDEDSTCK